MRFGTALCVAQETGAPGQDIPADLESGQQRYRPRRAHSKTTASDATPKPDTGVSLADTALSLLTFFLT